MINEKLVIIRLILIGIVAVMFCPATLSAFIINGTIVTLEPADRTADNTALIQGFLNNAAYTKIIIPPGTGNASWSTRPLTFAHNNTEIHLNANTVLEALSGSYTTANATVLVASGKTDIKVTGDTGAQILMHKDEYLTGQWRHALSFYSCTNLIISGLKISQTGGDGIYLGDANTTGYNSNVTITDVVVDGAARNGLSVISVNGLTVTNCTFKNTTSSGQLAAGGPWSGIDFEPNYAAELLSNISISNCQFLNNKKSGIQISPFNINGSSSVNISFSNCIFKDNGAYGIYLEDLLINSNSNIAFNNCSVQSNIDSGILVDGKYSDAGILSFSNCSLIGNNYVAGNSAFVIRNSEGVFFRNKACGNVQLNNIYIEQPANRYVAYFMDIHGTVTYPLSNVSGFVYASGGGLSAVNTINLDITAVPRVLTSCCPSISQFCHNWKLDETSGNTVNDSIGSSDGTMQNSPVWGIGRFGGAVTLDGVNQFVSIANSSDLNIGTGDFSISIWMQRSSDPTTNKRLLCKGASSDNGIGYALFGSNTSLGLILSNGVGRIYLTSPIPSLNAWHHFVFTIDRACGKAKAYVNGFYQGELDISAYNGGDITNTRNLLIGAENSGGNLAWPGKVDDVRIYKRVLSTNEIAYLAISASANWKFDEGSGTTVADSIGRASGLLQNNPAWTSGITQNISDHALTLDGVNQFVSIANSSDLNIGTGDFSISIWMQRNSDSTTNKRLIYKGASADNEIGYALFGSNTSLGLILSNGVGRIYLTSPIPSLNAWHHFVFTIDRASGKSKAYVNGIYQGELDISAYNGGDITNTRDILVGAASSSGYLAWPGKVDDVRIYKRVLSSDEVSMLYSATP